MELDWIECNLPFDLSEDNLKFYSELLQKEQKIFGSRPNSIALWLDNNEVQGFFNQIAGQKLE